MCSTLLGHFHPWGRSKCDLSKCREPCRQWRSFITLKNGILKPTATKCNLPCSGLVPPFVTAPRYCLLPGYHHWIQSSPQPQFASISWRAVLLVRYSVFCFRQHGWTRVLGWVCVFICINIVTFHNNGKSRHCTYYANNKKCSNQTRIFRSQRPPHELVFRHRFYIMSQKFVCSSKSVCV